MFYIYILYSNVLDKFYIGFTGDTLENRLQKHLSNHIGFTGKAKDWKMVYFETFEKKHVALKREKEIKSWKSRKRIQQIVSDFNATE